MEKNGNGRDHGDASPPGAGQARFTEDPDGATLDSGTAICCFDTQHGGRLSRWQWRTMPPPDALDPLTRYDPPRLLDLVDPQRGALIDHFLPLGTKLQEFASGEHREFGTFLDEPYRSQVVDSGGEIRIGLLRDGEIKAGKRVAEVRVAKSAAVRPTANDLSALYRIINSSLRPMQILFALEYNVYAPGLAEDPSSAPEGYYLIDGERPADASFSAPGVSGMTTTMALVNPAREMALQLGWDRECDLWRMPSPDGGPGVCLMAVWRIQLPPRDNWALGLWMAPS